MSKKVMYPVIIAKDGKDYIVNVPDLDLYTEGYSMIDAIDMARDIIGLCCMDYDEKNKKLPKASTYEAAMKICKNKNPEYVKGIITMVDIDIDKYREKMNIKTVRRNVTIPEYLNEAANKAGINVSKTLANALAKQLKFA